MPPHVGDECLTPVDYRGLIDGGNLVKLKGEKQFTVDDFRPIKSLGNGDMGTVFLVALRGTDTPYALKVMKKDVLRVRRNGHRAENEREILSKIAHPFLPTLHAHFENEKHSFLVLDYCHGGDLNVLRQKQAEKKFSENACRFYAAEVLLSLEYLHKLKIVYRDLKPENILIQSDGHIMLTDFDLSLDISERHWTPKPPSSRNSLKDYVHKETSRVDHVRAFFTCGSPLALTKKSPSRKNLKSRVTPEEMYGKGGLGKRPFDGPAFSFVGTEEYVAPEIVWGKGHGLPVDWWTLGILLYELYYGRTPFKGPNRKETFYNVLCKRPEFPGPRSSLIDLIEELLSKEPEKRLGTLGGAEEIKKHPFFAGVNWNELQYVSRTPVVPAPFSLEEVELEGHRKLEASGRKWSFTAQDSQKSSIKARLSGPFKLKSNSDAENQQVELNSKKSRIQITASESVEYTFSDDIGRTESDLVASSVDSRSELSCNPKEEVRLSEDELNSVMQAVFDEVF